MAAFSDYLKAINKNLTHGQSTEHTHRPALKTLLEAIVPGITATNEPQHKLLCGSPDLSISRKKIPLGHVETKDIGVSLEAIEKDSQKGNPKTKDGEQLRRYRGGLPNLLFTDYLEFRWYVKGEKRLTASIAQLEGKHKLSQLPNGEAELTNLLEAFIKQEALTVSTAKDLAQRMAGMTRIIRGLIINTFEFEKEKGWLHNWLDAFREVLIPDLDEKQFADMFAQTLAYGLFAARVHMPPHKEFSREVAGFNLPKTNPFLRKLFSEIAGVDMPDTIAWAVDDVVELLKHADLQEILEDFGKGKGKEDPVVHFYETFLTNYDSKLRKIRGVYYTPEPVVSYIVRSINQLLKTRFGRHKGLADEKTLILDPAVGTATFLYFIIDLIHLEFVKQKGSWNSYVANHLLTRIFGFELLMAPYAVAHLKLGMELQQTGYTFDVDQRLGIYMTNTLEEAAQKSENLFAKWVSDEANEAAEIKRERPILVVLANPPYKGHSANRSKEKIYVQKGHQYLAGFDLIQGKVVRVKKKAAKTGDVLVPNFIGEKLMDYFVVDGAWLNEKNPKWLQDDYVKFIRFAQWRIERTGEGIIGYITNHGYLDNPTFRGMRQSLLRAFNEIFVYNLHGNTKKKEMAPGDIKDQNVFDIQQGVAIMFCIKDKGNTETAKVHYADLWGSREVKYDKLNTTDVSDTNWAEVLPTSPSYFFVPQDTSLQNEYEQGWKINEAFTVNSLGIVSARDSLTIKLNENDIWQTVREFSKLSPEEARTQYGLGDDSPDWSVELAQRDLKKSGLSKEKITPILYRPFDIRYTYYTGNSRGFHCRPRAQVMNHMLHHKNVGLSSVRSVEIGGFEHVFCTKYVIGHHATSLKEVNYLFPLYLYAEQGTEQTSLLFEKGRHPNLSKAFIQNLIDRLSLMWIKDGCGNLKKTVGPEDVYHYAYAILYSPKYRTRYAGFLKRDYPRIPLTGDRNLFSALAERGKELTALHLMESSILNDFISEFPESGNNIVETVQYLAPQSRICINDTQGFCGVPKQVWEYRIGGYQVCEQWLKDRKGRKLTYDDIQHYQKILVALKETIRLMGEIDDLIPNWPLP